MNALLEKLHVVTPDLYEEDCDRIFKEIAEILLNDYAIEIQDRIYRMTDIEFYFYDANIDDARTNQENKKVTYERTTPAGCWFFPDSGIDISFKSDKTKGYGGGILIRGIEKVHPVEQITVHGPLNCYWELFDEAVSAFENLSPNPHLIPFDFDLHPNMQNSLRKGLSPKEKNPRKWRFFVNVR